MIGRIALAAAALLASPAASAQSIPETLDGIAADLAYGYCPLYLAGQFPLTGNEQLTRLGFTKAPETAPNARLGSVTFVSQKRGEVEISFGGSPEKVCQVNLLGTGAHAVVDKVRPKLSMMGLDFKPDAANSGTQPNGVSVETLMAKLDDKTVVRIQFIRGTVQGSPIGGIQLFSMDQ